MASLIEKLTADPKRTLKHMSTDDVAKLLEELNYAYYIDGNALVSDDIADFVKADLKKRDPKHPLLHVVGAAVRADDTRKTELPFWMGSLDKIKADEKVLARWKSKYVTDSDAAVVVSDKLDGISALLVYEPKSKKGTKRLFTRGDGAVGQDISSVLPYIQNIPKFENGAPQTAVAVRGELILARRTFDQKLSKRGANPRNLVAGVINAKVPDMDVLKHIQFIPYSVLQPAMLPPSDQMAYLKDTLAFEKVVEHQMLLHAQHALTSAWLSKILQERRGQSPYEVDGIVVSQDAPHALIKGKNPSYAFAFKTIVTDNVVEVMVTNVEWNISKDGFLKPVVEFDPVPIAGVQVKRATGFHGEYIQTNVIGPGARILVTRSGDVIPYILSVLQKAASGEPQMPSTVQWKWNDTHKEIMVDEEENEELAFKQLETFVVTLDVNGVGAGIVRKMYDAGIDSVKKIVQVTEAELAKIDGFGTRMAEKVYAALQKSLEKLNCLKLMHASNAFGRGFGERKLKAIVQALEAVITDERYFPSMQDLVSIEGIQTKTAEKFLEGLVAFRAFLRQHGLQAYCIKPKEKGSTASRKKKAITLSEKDADVDDTGSETSSKSSSSKASSKSAKGIKPVFAGMTFVFTGFRNKDLEEAIEARGGSVTTSVSKKTTMLITKTEEDTESSKAIKARDLGVRVLALSAFLKHYGMIHILQV